ncbi:MAG: alpha/beta hydrolase [Kofleriaceae bacterium]
METRWIDVNGDRLFTRIDGRGPPLLLLHGYPETSLTWLSTIAALRDAYTCIAPDLPGWGESTIAHRATLATFLADVAALIEQLDLGPVTVVGHDWGAAVAYGLAIHHSALVRRIVTVNFSPGGFQVWRGIHFGFFAIPLLPELAMWLWPAAIEHRLMKWWAAHYEAVAPEVRARYFEHARSRRSRRTTLASYRNLVYRALIGFPPLRMGPTGFRRSRPRMPWGVIWGMKDPIATPRVLESLEREFPDITVRRLADAGHFPQEEQPAGFATALRELI